MLARLALGPTGRIALMAMALFTILGLSLFMGLYVKYSRIIDEKLNAGPFANTAKIFAAPMSIAVGDITTAEDIAAELRRSGYNESAGNPVGYYQLRGNSIEIFPRQDSYFDQEPGVIKFSGGKISQIISLSDNTSRSLYQLEPQLITNVSGPSREKRRFVKFHDIPRVLVDALTSAEDKRFFQHAGLDPIRIVKAAYVDIKQGRREQGASTLTMQLAREFWLDQDKSFSRKVAEAIITLQLEQKLSKEQIFEDYSNQIYLGYRGSFRIRGFGEASEAFLGKDLSQITLPEAAQLAGLPRWPAYFDPFHHPDHAKDRRNVVLGLMRTNGYITDRDYALAIEAPITVARGTTTSVEAPYFVDLVNDTLQTKFQDENFQANAFRIYTTIDMRLQRIASEAVRKGMILVDDQIKKQKRFKGQTPPTPQVALVALDPHTGEVKALIGGRNYGQSQLNRALALRQPGSIFKPFVYAAAMDTAVEGGPKILTPSTLVVDEPHTFYYENGTRQYSPSNFKHEFYGTVPLRFALAHSLNVPTVKVAEQVGYQAVVNMANRAGLKEKIMATPAVALGSYDITPLEAAGGYTMFANQGRYIKPTFLSLVRSQDGKVMYKNRTEPQQVLDQRVAYVMTNMLEEVLRSGTAAGVRAKYNLNIPAAGKTGTSDRDGWFAGYTSELLCIVWVGFDDARDLDIEGAHSAAPIWAEFMKGALNYREYRDAQPFRAPDGIVSIEIDPQSGMPATPSCPKTYREVYIAGTEPVGSCPLHGGGRGIVTNVAGWDTQTPASQPSPNAAPAPSGLRSDSAPRITGTSGDGPASRAARQLPADSAQRPGTPRQAPAKKEEKKGLLHRIFGVFK
jgi:penicillin-binding protein 1B